MAKNNKIVEVEVAVEEVENIAKFQKELKVLNKKTSETLKKMASVVDLSEINANAKEALVELEMTKKDIGSPKTVIQKGMNSLSGVPIIGSFLKNQLKKIQKEYLSSANLEIAVSSLYDNMQKNASILSQRIGEFYTIGEDLLKSENKGLDLLSRVNAAIESEKDEQNLFELKKIQITLKNRISGYQEDQVTLKQIKSVTENIALKIEEETPASKERLLGSLVAYATITAAGETLEEFQKMRGLTQEIKDQTQDGIFNTLKDLIQSEEADLKELELSKKRAQKFAKRAEEVKKMISNNRKKVEVAYLESKEDVKIMLENKKEA